MAKQEEDCTTCKLYIPSKCIGQAIIKQRCQIKGELKKTTVCLAYRKK